MASTKIFVGSLPDFIADDQLRAEFSKYGLIDDIHLKANCEPGRQWAFVTFNGAEQAEYATEMTNGVLTFPGSTRSCEVSLAKNQAAMAPKKIFVGSLPGDISEMILRAEFSKYGQITDVFIKGACEPGRNWAFVTFATPEQASQAKNSCDRQLIMPGCETPCEVTLAKNQGKNGQDHLAHPAQPAAASYAYSNGSHAPPAYRAPGKGGNGRGYATVAPVSYTHPPAAAAAAAASAANAAAAATDAPRKIFVGTLPANTTEDMLRGEFSRYGTVEDTYLKPNCEPGRQWGFVTFTDHTEASYAKESTDRILFLPGAEAPCEVKLAKNQGKFGQSTKAGEGKGKGKGGSGKATGYEIQPPPPAAPPPSHLTTWRMYKTEAGLPYYHNANLGVTQWECPPELQVPGQGPLGGARRYAPY